MCFLGRFYSCSRAEKKTKQKWGKRQESVHFWLRLGVSWMEAGGAWNGAPSR